MPNKTSGLRKGNEVTKLQKDTQRTRNIASKGGYAKAEKARKQRKLEEVIFMVANTKITCERAIEELQKHGFSEDNQDYLSLTTLQMIQRAAQGDVKAAKWFLDSYREAQIRIEKERASFEDCTYNSNSAASGVISICSEAFIGIHKGQTAYFVGENNIVHGKVVKIIDHNTVEVQIHDVYSKIKNGEFAIC